jgi:hypothetical protein
LRSIQEVDPGFGLAQMGPLLRPVIDKIAVMSNCMRDLMDLEAASAIYKPRQVAHT